MRSGRALLVILDSVGIGGAADAAAYGDAGADTLRHIAQACARGHGDRAGLRAGPLALPNLAALGLGRAADLSSGGVPPGLETFSPPRAAWGYGIETSKGKDTPSGHWEIAGQPVTFDWGTFPDAEPAFPAALTQALVREAGLPGILGNRHASGTAIIAELGEAHVRTGKPICYTSVDSVFQIAAHEESFGLDQLYETCRVARKLCDPYRIGRVIARPFEGTSAADFRRTAKRRDFSVPPPAPTLLDRVVEAGGRVFAIGKIADIFAHRGVTKEIKADGNHALLDAALAAFAASGPGDLTIVNLIDFDQLHGHRRDVAGYAAALEAFDTRVPEIEAALTSDDLCIITADHGNDPTWRGTDHTREHVPILALGGGAPRPLGPRPTFADIGATLADHLGLTPPANGRSWLAP